MAVDFVPACVCTLGGAAFPDRAAGAARRDRSPESRDGSPSSRHRDGLCPALPGEEERQPAGLGTVPGGKKELLSPAALGLDGAGAASRPVGAAGAAPLRRRHRPPPAPVSSPPRPGPRCCREAPAGAAAGTGRPRVGRGGGDRRGGGGARGSSEPVRRGAAGASPVAVAVHTPPGREEPGVRAAAGTGGSPEPGGEGGSARLRRSRPGSVCQRPPGRILPSPAPPLLRLLCGGTSSFPSPGVHKWAQRPGAGSSSPGREWVPGGAGRQPRSHGAG